jgi:hypothetical protein
MIDTILGWIRSRPGPEADRKPSPGFILIVSDILIMTLGLFAGVVGCLAKPCKPEQWVHVKAARSEPEAMPISSPGEALEPAPVSEPGFADGLVARAA